MSVQLPVSKSLIAEKPKTFVYKNPKVKIGQGKLGPVDLIIHNGDLFAMKKVPKKQIDKPKRI